MRDFHKVMANSNAVIRYNPDHIAIQLNITSLETLKEIADVIHAEFDCELNSVSVVPESGVIVLKVPCSNNATCATCSCDKFHFFFCKLFENFLSLFRTEIGYFFFEKFPKIYVFSNSIDKKALSIFCDSVFIENVKFREFIYGNLKMDNDLQEKKNSIIILGSIL